MARNRNPENRKDPNKDTKPRVGWLQILLVCLQILKAALDLRLILLVVALVAIPVAPYLRLSQADAATCTYLGPRGLWEPGWGSHCPALALRHQFSDY
jgi:hypothetical protein